MGKEQGRGPRPWQQERSGGDNNWGGAPRRSFGQPRGDGPPRFSAHRPGGHNGGPPAAAGGGFDRDRPPRRTFRRQDDAPQSSGASTPALAQPSAVVAPRAMGRGIQDAKAALAEVMASLLASADEGLDVETVEATVSFAADGKFMGFGRGGAASLTLTMSALDAEDTLELDDGEDEESGAPAAPSCATDHQPAKRKNKAKPKAVAAEQAATPAPSQQARQGDHAILASDALAQDGDFSEAEDGDVDGNDDDADLGSSAAVPQKAPAADKDLDAPLDAPEQGVDAHSTLA